MNETSQSQTKTQNQAIPKDTRDLTKNHTMESALRPKYLGTTQTRTKQKTRKWDDALGQNKLVDAIKENVNTKSGHN